MVICNSYSPLNDSLEYPSLRIIAGRDFIYPEEIENDEERSNPNSGNAKFSPIIL
jgi:hypothetical protein